MTRWLWLAALLVASWAGAFGIAFAVVEWRDNSSFDADECQAAVAFWKAVEDSGATGDPRVQAWETMLNACGFHPD